jgi:hypothetical protein
LKHKAGLSATLRFKSHLRAGSLERGVAVHVHGKTKLVLFPLPVSEGKRLKNYLAVIAANPVLSPSFPL